MAMNKQIPKVLPPANGKKLWRVRRTPSGSHTSVPGKESNSSIECLQNSLRIAAAGKQYTTKKPPSRRPKTKPGMPTDFVFVDLSPVKNEQADTSDAATTAATAAAATAADYSSSASASPIESPVLDLALDSVSSIASEDCDSLFSYFQSSSSSFDDATNYNASLAQGYMQADDSSLAPVPAPLAADGPIGNNPTAHSYFDPAVNMGLGIFNVAYPQHHMDQQQPQQQQQQQQPHYENEVTSLNYQLMQEQLALQQFLEYNCHFGGDSDHTNNNTPHHSHTRSMPIIPTIHNIEAQPAATTTPPTHKRSKSTTSVPSKKQSKGGFQFKTYKGPSTGSKKSPIAGKPGKVTKKTRTFPNTPVTPVKSGELEDFMVLNNQFESFLNETQKQQQQQQDVFTPASDFSESEELEGLQKPLDLDNSLLDGSVEDFLAVKRDEFDFNAFIAI